ncbi:haloacid dehalogenase type II [Hoyosella rhizosphaerae]|uniref:HAD-superfamily hydrolase YfnB n=1 Tax=Hoyosella rhizosphaerae TaxID=1755582 RepID=A0A916U5R7_9ACTN|nr:haloacid dehalogenase type II [Hoyosella rhizosphaerae]MBN4926247.1 haloacid dehalogenase type II [Hoyosella rhizosphaerae]GGC60914.1 putative HAD-superfamily hydrolase YfnB [Hoyosella rhizosphaerae]
MAIDTLLFDVQGTLLDFFTPVHNEVSHYLVSNGIPASTAAEVTRTWRQLYFKHVGDIQNPSQKWTRVQQVYETTFTPALRAHGLPPATAETARDVSRCWTRLVPWPDVSHGLADLRSNATIATLSNTDMSTMVQLFKTLGIDWDAIFTAELFGAFKPEPAVYLGALRFLGARPENTAMVASHAYDLRAARELGLTTVYVHRPLEHGAPEFAENGSNDAFDHYVSEVGDIVELLR